MNDESRPKAALDGSGGPAPMVAGTPDNAQLSLAFADRQKGIEANLAAAESVLRDDRARVETALAALARNGDIFNADDVHEALTEGGPYNRNIVSSTMSIWSRKGWIAADWSVEPQPSAQRARHGSRNRWWRGTAAGGHRG